MVKDLLTAHNIAIRVYQGEYLVQKAKTIAGKEFTLLNLPFYLVHRIEREMDKIIDLSILSSMAINKLMNNMSGLFVVAAQNNISA
jgi:hypothetical protein